MSKNPHASEVQKSSRSSKKEKEVIPYYENVQVTDLEGNVFTINTTVPGPLRVEVSHLTHPAYTGKSMVVRSAGRMEQYAEKLKKMQGKQSS